MSIEKQKLYNEIETLPEELTNQVINFIEYLKLSYADTKSDNSITIKNKLQKGIDDINTNKKCSLEDLFKNLENI
ncbi:unknown [Clostridium sp. CAG:793]|nr:unknown [Clostridium sp. CAG:793]